MKTIFNTIVLLCFVSLAFSLPLAVEDRLQKLARNTKKCAAANVCFAIDGSGSVNGEQFKLATRFVQDVVNTLSDMTDTEYAANQFAATATIISGLTTNRDRFVQLMESASRKGGATSVGAGIVSCDFTLARRRGEPNKLVVITDGRNTFGGDPVRRANNFKRRDSNGRVCSVVVGNSPNLSVLQQISDAPVITVDDYISLALKIIDLVDQICETN